MIELNSWVQPVLVFAGILLTAVGGALGSYLTYKVSTKTAEKSAENTLIDQLQEELSHYRKTNDTRSNEQDRRLQDLEVNYRAMTLERDKLRDYAHTLRADILAGKPPPPAEWPVGVLR